MNITILNDDYLYERQSPVGCTFLKFVAFYLAVIFVSGVICNSLLLWILFSNKHLRTNLNIFIISLSVVNLLATVSEVPFTTVSNYNCRWIFKKAGCIGSGSIMYFSGCSGIYFMAAIAFERFYMVYKPFEMRTIGYKMNIIGIMLSIGIGLFWSVVPMFGWSYYSLEGALTSCSVEWEDRSFNVVSYNIAIFAVVYFIPLIVIIITGILIILKIKNLPNLAEQNKKNDEQVKKRIDKERKITKNILIMIVFFIISWTPYAIVSLLKAFFNAELDPVTTLLPATFAKTSLIWPALYFLMSNNSIRNKMKNGLNENSYSSSGKTRESIKF